jgi:hypothetical protein
MISGLAGTLCLVQCDIATSQPDDHANVGCTIQIAQIETGSRFACCCVSAELGHLKCDHGLWLTIANVLASGTVSILPLISGAVVSEQVAAYNQRGDCCRMLGDAVAEDQALRTRNVGYPSQCMASPTQKV